MDGLSPLRAKSPPKDDDEVMKSSQRLRRRKKTTNDFFKDVLDNAVRSKWGKSGKASKTAVKKGRRLSTLYSSNPVSTLVRKRSVVAGDLSASLGALSSLGRRSSTARKTSKLVLSSNTGSSPGQGMLSAFPEDSIASVQTGVEELLQSYAQGSSGNHLGPSNSVPGLLHSKFGGIPQGPSASRVFENTRDGIRKPKGKPWYCGYSNKFPKSSSSTGSTSVRYGLNGSLDIERLKRAHSRSVNFHRWVPRARGEDSLYDPYAPALLGSPKVWPKQANYVTGFQLDPKQPLPDIPSSLKRWSEREADAIWKMNKSIAEEREGRKRFAASTLASGSNTLRGRTDSFGRLTKGLSTSVSDAKRMKYWRGVTVMTTGKEGASDVREQLEKRHAEQQMRLDMRWGELEYLYKLIKQATTQRRPGLDDFFALYNELAGAAESSESGCCVSREDFSSIVLRLYVGSKRKNTNRLYSSFDIERRDQVDFRRIMASQRCLWRMNENALEKLHAIWALYSQDGQGSIDDNGDEHRLSSLHKDKVEQVLLSCAADADEIFAMKSAFERTFKQVYKSASFESTRNHISFAEFNTGLHNNRNAIIALFDKQLEKRLPSFLKSQAPHVGKWVAQVPQSQRRATVKRRGRTTMVHTAARRTYCLS